MSILVDPIRYPIQTPSQIAPVVDVDLEATIPQLVRRLTVIPMRYLCLMDEKDISSAETLFAVGHPPFPWTPTSCAVTTHGPADSPSSESLHQVSLPVEILVTPQERPESPWTPSYSTTVQGSGSINRTGEGETTGIDADQSAPKITRPIVENEGVGRERLHATATPSAVLRELAAVPPHLLQISDEQDARDEGKITTEAVSELSLDIPSEPSVVPNVSWRVYSLCTARHSDMHSTFSHR